MAGPAPHRLSTTTSLPAGTVRCIGGLCGSPLAANSPSCGCRRADARADASTGSGDASRQRRSQTRSASEAEPVGSRLRSHGESRNPATAGLVAEGRGDSEGVLVLRANDNQTTARSHSERRGPPRKSATRSTPGGDSHDQFVDLQSRRRVVTRSTTSTAARARTFPPARRTAARRPQIERHLARPVSHAATNRERAERGIEVKSRVTSCRLTFCLSDRLRTLACRHCYQG